MTTENTITFSYLINFANHLEDAEESILNRWMAHPDVQETLSRHKITPEFFGHYFGIKVIGYALGVLRGVNKLGNCPVIGVLLAFFEKKNIPLEDVFMICVNLKNSLLQYMLENKMLNNHSMHEISLLIDHNFSGVIREYTSLYTKKFLPSETNQTVESALSVCEPYAVRGDVQSTSALHYLQEIEMDMAVLDELDEIERETLSSVDFSGTIDQEAYREVISLFSDYVRVVNQLFEFNALAYTLTILIDLLKNTPLNTMEEEKLGMVTIYIKAIVDDLSLWRKAVFVDQSAEDIHYLDKTLMSSIAQLQILLSENENTSVEEIEFF
ncbi:MAG TPA: histidine kinase [Sulfuricurvum sp.]|nr:histidine kinase [Sulfuricurvum sp.]